MSLRTLQTRLAYKAALESGRKFDPTKAEPLRRWVHWSLVENEFPYDAIASTHHLLVPNRPAAARQDLLSVEEHELVDILESLAPDYDCYLENFPRHQSVKAYFHIHLLVFQKAGHWVYRPEFSAYELGGPDGALFKDDTVTDKPDQALEAFDEAVYKATTTHDAEGHCTYILLRDQMEAIRQAAQIYADAKVESQTNAVLAWLGFHIEDLTPEAAESLRRSLTQWIRR